jgi:hypothetical protein
MRVLLLAIVMALLLGLLAAPAFAAQPGKECGEDGATSSPPGFDTPGFANAEEHYAGSEGTPSAANGNPKAVSQYDVACFRLSQH